MSFFGGDFFGADFFEEHYYGPYVGVSVFFGGEFFDGGFFQKIAAEEAAVRGGRGDNDSKRSIIKPTGLPPYREIVEKRVEETREIHQEVIREARKILTLPEALKPPRPIRQMSLAEIEAEIGVRLREQMKDEEEIALMLLAAAVAG